MVSTTCPPRCLDLARWATDVLDELVVIHGRPRGRLDDGAYCLAKRSSVRPTHPAGRRTDGAASTLPRAKGQQEKGPPPLPSSWKLLRAAVLITTYPVRAGAVILGIDLGGEGGAYSPWIE